MPSDASEPTAIDPDAILRQPFPTVRKGYDPLEVQKYLMAVAGELRAGKDRERDLERRLADAKRRIDELENLSPQKLTSMLGEETAKVIEAANTAAIDIRTKAEDNVARLLRDAQDRAGALLRDAESVLERKTTEADAVAAEITSRAEEQLQQARAQAQAETEAGRERAQELLTEAQRQRERLLRDLVRRRQTLRQQIEQLHAGRERLLKAFVVVRESIDRSTGELEVALPEAKEAADAALQRSIRESDELLERELAELGAAFDRGEATVVDETDLAAARDRSHAAGAPGAQLADELLAEGEVDAELTRPGPEPGPKAPDPLTGRHSSAVRVISGRDAEQEGDAALTSSERVADLFARIRQEASAQEEHGEPAARVIPTEPVPEAPDDDGAPAGAGELTAEQLARALAELQRGVSRHVKRELSDEQNEMLDAVRRERRVPAPAAVLPEPEAHVERYASAAFAPLSDAAGAGARSLAGEARGGDDPRVGGLAREVAAELAADVVAPLRDRLEGCFAMCAEDEDSTALSEALAACYREWRTQRVDAATGQAVVAAFNRGVLASARDGAELRWLPEPGATPCPVCEANASQPAVTAGEPYESGATAPPAHPECRCVLVAAGA